MDILCWIAPRDVVPGMLYAEGIVRAIGRRLEDARSIEFEKDRTDAAIAQLVNAVRRHLVPSVADQRREPSSADRKSSHRRRWIPMACIAVIGLALAFFVVNRPCGCLLRVALLGGWAITAK